MPTSLSSTPPPPARCLSHSPRPFPALAQIPGSPHLDGHVPTLSCPLPLAALCAVMHGKSLPVFGLRPLLSGVEALRSRRRFLSASGFMSLSVGYETCDSIFSSQTGTLGSIHSWWLLCGLHSTLCSHSVHRQKAAFSPLPPPTTKPSVLGGCSQVTPPLIRQHFHPSLFL